MRGRALSLALVAAALAGAAAALPSTAPARAPFNAHLTAPGHHPKANRNWPITITARTWSGKPLSGRVSYEYVYGGQVVARRSNYRFRNGRFRDVIIWPARSAGIRLTFRPVVRTRLGVVRLPYWVVVRA